MNGRLNELLPLGMTVPTNDRRTRGSPGLLKYEYGTQKSSIYAGLYRGDLMNESS